MCCNKRCGSCDKCIKTPCGCSVYISSDCVNNVKSVFECSEIESGLSLTETLELLDAFICTKFEEALNYLRIVNVGSGSQIYKGISNIGEKQLRTLVSLSDIITISTPAPTDNTINFDIDQEAFEEAIGNSRCDISNTITITKEGNCVRYELPATTDVPTIYVNSLYTPVYPDTKGDGTLARPFTNTRVYNLDGTVASITANTAIQNALDFYSGGNRLAPVNSGYKIIIQNNNSSYTFPGDFSYSNINLRIEGTVNATATATKIIDMDNASHFNATTAIARIELEVGAVLRVDGEGFYNTGNTVATTSYATGRTILLFGEGTIYSTQNAPTKYLINSDGDSLSNAGVGSNNDGNLTFDIRCKILSELQGVYKVGGLSRIDNYNSQQSGTLTNTVSSSIKAFHQTGGQVRNFEGASTIMLGGTRTDGVTFTPVSPFTPVYISQASTFSGNATNLFTKTNTSPVTLQVTNSSSGYGLSITNVFASPNLWTVFFKNNVIQTGSIDTTITDLTGGNTYSSINTIGDNVIEILVIHTSRENAIASGRPRGSAFLNRKTVTQANFVTGTEMQILNVGTTNWTSIGASAATVGVNFTYNGVSVTGSGGTAYVYTRDVILQ